MGNFPGSKSSATGRTSSCKKRVGKALKRLKKLGTKETCTGQSEDTESIETVPTDTGQAAWQACAGSVILTTAVFVINFTMHEAVRSINDDFREYRPNDDMTTSLPAPDCYSGLRSNFETIANIYLPSVQFVYNQCPPSDILEDEALYNCFLYTYFSFHQEFERLDPYCAQRTVDRDFLYYYPCLYYTERVQGEDIAATMFASLCSSLWPAPETFLDRSGDAPSALPLVSVENLYGASLKTEEGEQRFGDTLNYVFVAFGLAFVLVEAVLSVYFGYRVVSIIGSILVAIGFFFASFIDTDDAAPIQLLVGGVAGIGTAFLRLAAVASVLEYFKELRMRVIVMSGLGAVVINFLLIGITFADNAEFYWRAVFRLQLIPAILSLVISFILKPVLLVAEAVEEPMNELQDRIEEKKDEITCITKLSEYVFSRELFTNKVFYLVLGVYFCDQIGRPIFSEGVQPMIIERKFEDNDLKVKLQPLLENIGALIGLGLLLIIPNNQSKAAKLKEANNPTLVLHDLARNLTILAVLNIAVGVLCMTMPSVKAYALILIYSAVFGFTEGVFNSLMQDFIPDGFGRRHIRMVAGFLGFVAGVGSVIAGAVKDGIEKRSSRPHTSFYFCGVCLLISGALSLVSRFVVMRDAKLKERINRDIERDKKQKEKDRRERERQTQREGHTNPAVSTEEIEIDLEYNTQQSPEQSGAPETFLHNNQNATGQNGAPEPLSRNDHNATGQNGVPEDLSLYDPNSQTPRSDYLPLQVQ